MPADVIVFPDQQELKKEVDKLRTELSMLVLEYDELRFIECRNIEALYMLAVGSLEYKAYEAECLFLRLKRKCEMVQVKLNRQEKVVTAQIEKALDEEFESYKEKLREKMEQMNAAIERGKCDALSDAEAKELKRMYRRIVKAIHPDIHPDIDKTKIELFNNAVDAYANGDLITIRVIDQMVSDPLTAEIPDSSVKMKHDKERLEQLIKAIKERIDKCKSDYPYTVKELVTDPEKMAARKAEILSVIQQYEEMIASYNVRIDEMMR